MWPFTKKKEQEVKVIPTTLVDYIGWRNNMWVMTPDGVGIVFKLGTEVDVHLTDANGDMITSKVYPILALRQALFKEIPQKRRGITKEVASTLGYK